MKLRMKSRFILSALVALMGLMRTEPVAGQTFTTLHSFTNLSFSPQTNVNGAIPCSGVLLDGDTLYGTAYAGGEGNGTIFSVKTNGTAFTTLHNFDGLDFANNDGARPVGDMMLSEGVLYGTAQRGGAFQNGSLFRMNTNGTGFTNLHNFTALPGAIKTNSDGAYPTGDLILLSNVLYGTASLGGMSGKGTVFKINSDGTDFITLHSFSQTFGSGNTNSEGANPTCGLLLVDNTLYGTAPIGGIGGGTIFSISTDGTGFTNLYNFDIPAYRPQAGLILADNILYGTTTGSPAVFSIHPDGTGFTILHTFQSSTDGFKPVSRLILSGSTLFGTATNGGSAGDGTVFAVDTNSSAFTVLHTFTARGSSALHTNSDGAFPYGGVVLSDRTLYGTATLGGNSGAGTVFSLTLPPPQLTIISLEADVVLTWPTNAPGFTLQSTTNLVSPVTWNTNLPSPIVINGQNIVTNPITGAQQFFRLSQ
jgi:uncharacterized repeat protein (TIGR03803 family)